MGHCGHCGPCGPCRRPVLAPGRNGGAVTGGVTGTTPSFSQAHTYQALCSVGRPEEAPADKGSRYLLASFTRRPKGPSPSEATHSRPRCMRSGAVSVRMASRPCAATSPEPSRHRVRRRLLRTRSIPQTRLRSTAENMLGQHATNSIAFWMQEGRWPASVTNPTLERLLARKKSLSALSRERPGSAASTPSDDQPRGAKSASGCAVRTFMYSGRKVGVHGRLEVRHRGCQQSHLAGSGRSP